MTLTQCATAAAQYLGILDSGEGLSSQQLSDALIAINNMIDGWSGDRLMALSAGVVSQATTAATISYALGTRYSQIEAASIVTPAPSLPLKVCTAVEWSRIPDRGVTASFMRLLYELAPDRPDIMALMYGLALPSNTILAPLIHLFMDNTPNRDDQIATLATSGITNAAALAALIRIPGTGEGLRRAIDMTTVLSILEGQPRYLFYDRGNTTGTIYLAGPPQNGTIQLLVWTAMSQFADTTTALTMLPNYAQMLQLAAAVTLAPQYSVEPSPNLLRDYADAVSRWRQNNASILGPEPSGGIASPAAATTPVTETPAPASPK
jgi:hypothetical protein